ncbi:MAG: thymidine phosphorylase, partial [Clostridiales bacterium]|nr:thymidine phosphorylase [Clostridiales bacterium]
MRMVDVISKKRDRNELTKEEIEFIVRGTAEGTIPDYQLSAFLMAAYLNGLSHNETLILTQSMAYFGDVVDLSSFGKATVDKHSTGGVGDKTTLVVAPAAAACGAVVAKMSGRALGHTGGTLDKLESIPGFNCGLSNEEFIKQVMERKIAVISQTASLAPADKRLYALRDVTATVNSLPLIAASIMSKKLAAGAKNIVLDVKCGVGAFMESRESALELAELMVRFGNGAGRNTAAFITDMNEPLGYAIGNSLEVEEAVRVLLGEKTPRFYELCVSLSGAMVSLAMNIPFDEACLLTARAIENKPR